MSIRTWRRCDGGRERRRRQVSDELYEILKGSMGYSRTEVVVISPKLYGVPISPQFMDERADGHFFRFSIFFHINKPKFIDIEKEEC